MNHAKGRGAQQETREGNKTAKIKPFCEPEQETRH